MNLPVKTFNFQVVGCNYRGGDFRRAEVQQADELSLQPEPGNPHDANAIKVMKQGIHIGYIPRSFNVELLSWMKRSEYTGKVVVTSAWPNGCEVAISIWKKEAA